MSQDIQESPLVARPVSPEGQPPARRVGFVRYPIMFAVLAVLWCYVFFGLCFPGSFLSRGELGMVLVIGFAVVFGAILPRRITTKKILVAVAVYAVFLGAIHQVTDSSVSRFKETYLAIHVGMSLKEVIAVVDRHFPDQKPTMHLTEEGGYIGLGGVVGPSCAEFIGVFIRDGRVYYKQYLPD